MDTARTRRTLTPGVAAVLLASLAVALTLLAAPRAGAARPLEAAAPSSQPVVLAQDDGLTLIGSFGALRSEPAPVLDDLSRVDAAKLAPLPRLNVYFRGAVCRWRGRFRSPVLMTFQLPKAIFARTSLPLYRLEDGRWQHLHRRAVVGDVNTTASATIVRPGRYAICLTRAWKMRDEDGYRLVVYSRPYQTTSILSPELVAEGATTDPSVIQAVMDVAGQTEAQARSTLVSYDSSTHPVSVFRLTKGAAVLRNWSGTSTVGRWFAPSGGGDLPSPGQTRAVCALPACWAPAFL